MPTVNEMIQRRPPLINAYTQIDLNIHGQHVRDRRTLTLKDIFEEIDSKFFIIPIFQRDITWKIKNRVDLLNFMIRGISYLTPISLNKLSLDSLTGSYSDFGVDRELIDRTELEQRILSAQRNNRSVYSIIDGLQRISTLLLCKQRDDSIAKIFYDIKKSVFLEIKDGKDPKAHHFHICEFLLGDMDFFRVKELFLSHIENIETKVDYQMKLESIRTQLLEYSFSTLETNNLTMMQEWTWFTNLNTSGVNLSSIQVSVGPASIYGFDFIRYAHSFKEQAEYAFRNRWESGQVLTSRPEFLTSVPASALTPLLEILRLNGNWIEHTANFSPLTSDEKSKIWGNDWFQHEDNDNIDRLNAMSRISLLIMREAASFWANILDQTNLVLTAEAANEKRFRFEHFLYVHGFISWSKKDICLNFIKGDSELNEESLVLTPKENDYLIEWVLANETCFHNKNNSARRKIFTRLINEFISP